jgi:TP901-1 family phage major tail protein
MVGYSGNLVLLKIKDENNKYQTIGGMRTTRFLLNNQLIDISNKTSGRWRDLLSGAGTSSVSITGSGVFTNSESEKLVRNAAFDHEKMNFIIIFGNGDKLVGSFVISTYERVGNISEEEVYNVALESSGKISYHNIAKSDNGGVIALS